MREIKFRAWNKGIKKMVLVTNIMWTTTGDKVDYPTWSIEGIDEIKTKDGEDTNKIVKQEDFILLQFTGLKDKNGKDIYEGDILTGWSWDAANKNDAEDYIVITDPSSFEVIGNIYENPGMLK